MTDDSELALCMMWGIINGDKKNKGTLDNDSICEYYKKWVNSPPFDIGISTTNALKPLTLIDSGYAQASKKAAAQLNANSQSNGSLMRISPMIVWAAGLKEDEDFCKAI